MNRDRQFTFCGPFSLSRITNENNANNGNVTESKETAVNVSLIRMIKYSDDVFDVCECVYVRSFETL